MPPTQAPTQAVVVETTGKKIKDGLVQSFRNPEKQARLLSLMAEVANSTIYSGGNQLYECEALIDKFHQEEYGQKVYSVVVHSCGAALAAAGALIAQHLEDRGELRRREQMSVAVQNNTFLASWTSTSMGMASQGATPRLAIIDSSEVHPESMFYQDLMVAILKGDVVAVVITHVGGWMSPHYVDICRECKARGIMVIEDGAHVFGLPGSNHLNHLPNPMSLSDVGVYSFYATKSVPCGEGGAVICQNYEDKKFVKKFVDYGKEYTWEGTKAVTRYPLHGFNMRMDEWTAAALRTQLEFLPEILAARERDAARLLSVGIKLHRSFASRSMRHTTWYKFPAESGYHENSRQTGKIYAESDQLLTAMRDFGGINPSPRVLVKAREHLANSLKWPSKHVCLPIGEDLYEGMSDQEVHDWIMNK